MRRFLPKVAGVLLAVVFVFPAQAQPTDKPFPSNAPEARAAVVASLKAMGQTATASIESRPALQKLAVELSKSYSDVPKLEELKQLLFFIARPGPLPSLDIVDPDRAPLILAGFYRQDLRGPNPELKRVQKHTWPPDLSHGEKVALQAYTGNEVYGKMNADLRTKGTVAPFHALVHERLQAAFKKAQPFDPPVLVSRGINIDPKGGALEAFLNELRQAQKEKKPYRMSGYVSCSVGANTGFGGNIKMQIMAVHGLDVVPISLYPEERELLLNHHSTFLVKDVKLEGNVWKIQLDQLPPQGPQVDGK
jgi:hypothetical protein